MIVTVFTVSGSVYHITETSEGWTLSADNQPNPSSAKLAGTWPIQRPIPWPPEVGKCLTLLCIHTQQPPWYPGRMPGGGRYTSSVRAIAAYD